ncbi:DUF416 family protein [Microbulbifer sp. DLAB2-AF]|uniref:DUF416 family protein n=1 Tax=Microbulbifer sp. DLAB2-AF TaxID=3243395 RepID=UPI004039AC0B
MYPLERVIEGINNQLDKLPSPMVGIFFLSCAERLFPLFEEFSLKNSWGDANLLRDIINSLWTQWDSEGLLSYRDLAEKVNAQLPDTDKYDNLEATFAQSLCISVDASLRAFSGKPVPSLVEYVFEPIKMAICYKKTGYLDVGSDGESEFEEYLINTELMKKEIHFQEEVIAFISSPSKLSVGALRLLRAAALDNKWSIAKLTQ